MNMLFQRDFSITTCSICDIVFAVTKTMAENRKSSRSPFYCPNGHEICFFPALQGDMQKLHKMEESWKRIPTSERSCDT